MESRKKNMGDRRGYNSYNDRDRDRDRHGGERRRSFSNSDSRSHYQERSAHTWSWACATVSIVSMTLFVSWFGIIGLIFTGLSYTDHKVGDYKRARYKQRWAWCCAVSGILVTIISIVLLMLVMYVFDIVKPTFKYHSYWVPYWLSNELNNVTST